MKKVILVANQCQNLTYNSNYDYIGIDKGALYCLQNHIHMQFALGDFDSISLEEKNKLEKVCQIITLPVKKNETDGEYAIRYAHSLGYESIEVYGVIGGRQDHFLTILRLLQYHDIPFTMIDDQNRIYRLEKGTYEIKKNSTYFSLFPCEEMSITLKGVAYPLDNVKVRPQDLYLVSNEIIDTAVLTCTGKVIVIESFDKKDV